MLGGLLKRAKLNAFARSILVVLSGTFLAQLIPIVASPALTRFYTPEQFGVLGAFFATATFIGTMSTGRYELAILSAKSRDEAGLLSFLCTLLAAVVSLIGGLALCIFWINFPQRDSQANIFFVFCSVSVAAFSYAYFQVKSHELIFLGEFPKLARYKIVFAASVTLFQLGLALSYVTNERGLVAGQILGMAATAIILLMWGRTIDIPAGHSSEELRNLAVKYKKFPIFSLPADLANIITNQLPPILLLTYFSAEQAGLFVLTQRILNAPISLLSNAVLDVFKNKAISELNSEGNCRSSYLITFKILICVGLPAFIILAVIGPTLFSFIFGSEWRGSGEIASMLAPMFLLRFVASPLSYVFYARHKQQIDLLWQLSLLILTVLPFYFFSTTGNASDAILAYSIVYCCMYIVYLLFSYRVSVQDSAIEK